MTKDKITISVDPGKLTELRRITGADSVSGAIDTAMDFMIRRVRTVNDIAAYQAMPPTPEEMALANWQAPRVSADIADDTDWDLMFPDEEE